MAKTHLQRIHEDLWDVIDRHPNARVSDTLKAFDAVIKEIWQQLPPPKGANAMDKHGRKFMKDAVTKRYRLV
jgi:hypothetical protein